MFVTSRFTTLCLLVFISLSCLSAPPIIKKSHTSPPDLQLAHSFNAVSSGSINQYWISEKLDGVRAYWDGNMLISRQGNTFTPPPWFTEGFPQTPLDGELWITRNSFEKLSSIVRSHRSEKIDTEWENIKFMIFDMPKDKGTFSERLEKMRLILNDPALPTHIQLITQFRVHSLEALDAKLEQITANGGEGLMLHKQAAYYTSGRNHNILKFKKHEDAEAIVIGYSPGKGKYKGMMGALIVELTDGKVVKLGTGFSDILRENPPSIGATITYRYNGLTHHGLPRFARFLRVR